MSATTDLFDRDDPPVLGANPFVGLTRRQVGGALARLAQRVAVEPAVAAATAVDATGQLIRVGVGRSDIAPSAGDRRFADKAWQNNPAFRRLMQAYLVEQQAAHRLIDDVELDDKSRGRAHFAMSLVTEALAPTNNLLTNPNALAKAAQTRGQSLLAGARHFAHDLRHNGGMPSQVDTRPFTVGRNLATTPGQVVYRSEVFELIQYQETAAKVYANGPWWPSRRRSTSTTSPTWRQAAAWWSHGGRRHPLLRPQLAQPDRRAAGLEPRHLRGGGQRGHPGGVRDHPAATRPTRSGSCAGGDHAGRPPGPPRRHAAIGLVNSATFLVAGLDTAPSPHHQPGVAAGRSKPPAAARNGPGVLSTAGHGQGFRVAAAQRPGLELLGEQLPAGPEPARLRHPLLEHRHHPAAGRSALRLSRPVPHQRPGLRHPRQCSARPSTSARSTVDSFVVAGLTDHIIPWDGAYRTTQLLGGDSRIRAEQRAGTSRPS